MHSKACMSVVLFLRTLSHSTSTKRRVLLFCQRTKHPLGDRVSDRFTLVSLLLVVLSHCVQRRDMWTPYIRQPQADSPPCMLNLLKLCSGIANAARSQVDPFGGCLGSTAPGIFMVINWSREGGTAQEAEEGNTQEGGGPQAVGQGLYSGKIQNLSSTLLC